jgi:hypothetical protein
MLITDERHLRLVLTELAAICSAKPLPRPDDEPVISAQGPNRAASTRARLPVIVLFPSR